MVRPAQAVLVLAFLLLVPPSVQAQDPPVTGNEVTHVVQPGETLGSIAIQYYGSMGSWQRIFEANRNGLQDPDRIQPGMELRIPGAMAGSRAGAVVTGMEMRAGGPGQAIRADTLSLAERRALLRGQPFQPEEPPAYEGERTVFFGTSRMEEAEGTGLFLSPLSEVPTLSPGAFFGAGWIKTVDESSEALGQVDAFVGGQGGRRTRTSILPYDEIRLDLDDGVRAVEGDRFMLVREGRAIEGVGRIQVPTALVEVRRVDDAGVVARMVNGFAKAEIGNLVMQDRTFPLEPGVYPTEPPMELEGQVIAFEALKEVYLPGDRLFIDLGSADGVSVGDEFSGYAGASGGWDGALAGTFQVVGVRDGTATLRIRNPIIPQVIRQGLTVSLTGTMP